MEVKQQISFGMGEVSKAFWRKVQSDKYWLSCSTAENTIVTAFGTMLKRPGFLLYFDLTNEDIILDDTAKFFILDLQSGAGELIIVFIVVVGNYVALWVKDSPSSTIIQLTDYTAEQLASSNFVPVGESIIILNKEVSPHRIQYDGTFTQAVYTLNRPPCFDFGTVNYYNCKVSITVNSSTKITTITLDFAWPVSLDPWIGGTIQGPGVDSTAQLGFGIITSATVVGSTTEFVMDTIAAFDSSNDIAISGFGLIIRQPIFTDALGYCNSGVYFQNRLWMTGHPKVVQGIFGSQVSVVDVFDTGTQLSTDAIIEVLDVSHGDLLYFNSGKHLELFSVKAQFTTPNSDDGLTPSNSSFKLQSSVPFLISCRPVCFQNYSFYAGKDGKSIYVFYETDFVSSSYKSDLINQYSSHLINYPIKLAVFNGSSDTLTMLAVLNQDKSISFLQYNESLEVQAWTHPAFDGNIQVIDMDSTGFELFLFVKLLNVNKYVILVLDITKSVFVDCAIGPLSLIHNEVNVFSGLDLLKNGTCYVVSENGDANFGSGVVTENGQLTIDATYINEDYQVYIGYKFLPILSPLPLVSDPSLLYNFKTVLAVYVDYIDSLAITVNGQPIPYQNISNPVPGGSNLVLQSGTFTDYPLDGYSQLTYLTISQTDPVAWHILSLGYTVSEGDL